MNTRSYQHAKRAVIDARLLATRSFRCLRLTAMLSWQGWDPGPTAPTHHIAKRPKSSYIHEHVPTIPRPFAFVAVVRRPDAIWPALNGVITYRLHSRKWAAANSGCVRDFLSLDFESLASSVRQWLLQARVYCGGGGGGGGDLLWCSGRRACWQGFKECWRGWHWASDGIDALKVAALNVTTGLVAAVSATTGLVRQRLM